MNPIIDFFNIFIDYIKGNIENPIATLVAVLIPIVILYYMHSRNLYQTGEFGVVVAAFAWGAVAFGMAVAINVNLIEGGVDRLTIVQLVAPIEEEIFKSLIFIYLFKRINFTYFVDAAIYGFAIGIGFAVVENLDYIRGLNADAAFSLAISRVLSTNMIHAAASALIGMEFGRARFFKLKRQIPIIAQGFVLAMALHLAFNNLVTRVTTSLLLVYAILLGALALWYLIGEMNEGMQDAKEWIEEKLGMGDRVTKGEAAVVNRISDLQEILAPIAAQFGEDKAEDVEQFLFIQARLGILRKNQERLQDEHLLKETQEEIDELRVEMEVLRKNVGSYTMMTLRNLFPEDNSPVLASLNNDLISERLASKPQSSSGGLWTQLQGRTPKDE